MTESAARIEHKAGLGLRPHQEETRRAPKSGEKVHSPRTSLRSPARIIHMSSPRRGRTSETMPSLSATGTGAGSVESAPDPVRLLVAAESGAARTGDRITVSEQTLRRFAIYRSRFDTGLTVVESGPHPDLSFPMPGDIRPVWIPGYGSKRQFLAHLPTICRSLWRPVRSHGALLACAPVLHSLPALVLAFIARTPSYVLMVGSWDWVGGKGRMGTGRVQKLFAWALTNFSALLATRVLVHGDALAEELIGPLRRRVVFVNQSPLTGEDFAPIVDRDLEAGLLCVCRLIPRKRIDVALRAIRVLHNRGIPARIDIVGDGQERKSLEELAEQLGIADATTFHGFIDDRDRLRAIYRSAFAFLLTSEDEGIALTVMESMAAGTPVVSTPATGMKGFLSDGIDALMVVGPDPDAVAEAVTTLVKDPHVRSSIASAAQAKVRDLTAERWVDTLHCIITTDRAKRRRRGDRHSTRRGMSGSAGHRDISDCFEQKDV
jgi:glycosyltransferase involved in cell wall biosynthesis